MIVALVAAILSGASLLTAMLLLAEHVHKPEESTLTILAGRATATARRAAQMIAAVIGILIGLIALWWIVLG